MWPALSTLRKRWPYEVRKPVIAAINGHAIGVGITYPMLCDVRIVAEDAKVQFAFVRRGAIPELGSHATVQRVATLNAYDAPAPKCSTGRTPCASEQVGLNTSPPASVTK